MTSHKTEATHVNELLTEGSPSALSSFLAWTGLAVATAAVCGLMGGLWMFMLGIQI